MWDKLLELGQPMNMPWLILGDFNCVKSATEKQLGATPTCESNPVWCKLDRVLYNNEWLEAPALKLKALKGHLKAFNNLHFSHISVRAKDADLALQDAQIQLESDPENATIRDLVRNSFPTSPHLRHEVPTLPVDNAVFNWGPKLSSELALELCRVVTPEEVKQAIFNISDNKHQDRRISACFFKRAWHIVGDQVCTAVLDFFRSGHLLRQLNHSIIALVPKSDHCPTVADYRPISCCNVIYKAITKIIADRLAPALEHLTDRCQAAFVGDGALQTTSSLRRKWSGSTRGNGFHLDVQLMLTYARHSTRYRGPSFHRRSYDVLPRGPSIRSHLDGMPSGVSGRFRPCFNTSKSSIFTAGIENNILCDILARTEFTRGEMPVREWSVSGYKSSHSQRQSLRKSTGFVGIFSGTKRAPVAWEDICHPKNEGGLGIRHIQTWNVALLARVLWNIHRKADTLWVQWIDAVYLKGGSVWDWQPKKGDSPLLQRLAEIRNKIITAFGSPEAAIEHMASGAAVRDSIRPKYMSTSGRNEQNSLGRR
ncbi:UNVERIFIED_CONTAM: hypothetical protein Scaly_2028800 [Sesamum calycinum]|uniref:Endonuclease/exonuclease/phosphatase domain-containing protein n=1 Tax=Sesamum calycinum TaxID=2727403 RepID=A0AAW2N1W1_9LAMI